MPLTIYLSNEWNMQNSNHICHTHIPKFFKIQKSKGIFFTPQFVFSERLHHIFKNAFITHNCNATQHKMLYMCKHMVFSKPQQKKKHTHKEHKTWQLLCDTQNLQTHRIACTKRKARIRQKTTYKHARR